MTTIPEFMPVLSSGAHRHPSEGACVMEMVSFLAGEQWSDFPTCTNMQIARAAQFVNDWLADDERAELMLPLIPRLMQTARSTPALDNALHLRHEDLRTLVYAAADVDFAKAAREFGYPRLVAMLDCYDQATGRQSKAELPDTDTLRRMAELTGASK